MNVLYDADRARVDVTTQWRRCCVLQTGVRVNVSTVIRIIQWWRCCVLQTGVRVDISTVNHDHSRVDVLCVADRSKGGRHHSIVEVLCVADRGKSGHRHCDQDHSVNVLYDAGTVRVDVSTVITTTQ